MNIFFYQRKFFLFIIIFVIIFPGCLYIRKPALLPCATRGFFDEKKGVECRLQQLSSEESYKIFGSDMNYYGYQPCLLELYNPTPETYSLSWRYVTVPLTSHYVIKDISHYNTSLFAFTTSLLALIYCWPIIPIAIVPTAFAMAQFNKEVDQIIDEYGLKDSERIKLEPYERVSKILFIYGWHKGTYFDIGLLNIKSHEFTKFTIIL